MLTNGYELITAITNLIIFFTAIYIYFKTRQKRYWNLFYLLISIAGFMGTIIHGIVLMPIIIKILWIILSFIFSLIINLLLIIFIDNQKYTFKHVFIFSIILYLIFTLEMIFKIDFLMTFIIYAALIIILLFYLIFKKSKNSYFIIGLIIQVLGGLFQFDDNFHIYYFDNNGIYHIALLITMLLFYFGIDKNKI